METKVITKTIGQKRALLAKYDELRKTMKHGEAMKKLGFREYDVYNWRSDVKKADGKNETKVVTYSAKTKKFVKKVKATEPTDSKKISVIFGTVDQIAAILRVMNNE